MAADVEEQSCFGPYRVLRRVGSGGMGSVFEAEDTGLGHRVALKLLHPHVARRPGAVERFLREGRAVARIRHPHVVQVFALGLEAATPYLAMELLRGDDLSQVIAREGRLSVDGALDLVLPVVAAVAAAHDAGVIHRDLKPSNVCITRGPGGRSCPKVVDFGVSKVLSVDGAAELTVSDSVVGTAAYMSPEQARAASAASFRSDQYSLAALLYQCVTGDLPFSGRSVYEIVESIMTAPLGPPSVRASGIPPALDEAVLRAMSRNPDDRYPSVRAFGAALLPLASERARLALAAEFEERPAGVATDTGRAVARDAQSTRPDSDSDHVRRHPDSCGVEARRPRDLVERRARHLDRAPWGSSYRSRAWHSGTRRPGPPRARRSFPRPRRWDRWCPTRVHEAQMRRPGARCRSPKGPSRPSRAPRSRRRRSSPIRRPRARIRCVVPRPPPLRRPP